MFFRFLGEREGLLEEIVENLEFFYIVGRDFGRRWYSYNYVEGIVMCVREVIICRDFCFLFCRVFWVFFFSICLWGRFRLVRIFSTDWVFLICRFIISYRADFRNRLG